MEGTIPVLKKSNYDFGSVITEGGNSKIVEVKRADPLMKTMIDKFAFGCVAKLIRVQKLLPSATDEDRNYLNILYQKSTPFTDPDTKNNAYDKKLYEMYNEYLADALPSAIVENEERILRKFKNSEFIVQLVDSFVVKGKHHETEAVFVLERMSYDLNSVLSDGMHRLSVNQIAALNACILSALEYMHENGVVHKDLKFENVLLSSNGCVKLCDFGGSVEFSEDSVLFNEVIHGTPYTMAPELFIEGAMYDKSVDVWSLGVMTYLLTRKRKSRHDYGAFNSKKVPDSVWGSYKHNKTNYAFFSGITGLASIQYLRDSDADVDAFIKKRSKRYTPEKIENDIVEGMKYADVFQFSHLCLAPYPHAGPDGTISRNVELKRASIAELMNTSLVREMLGDSQLQKRTVVEIVSLLDTILKEKSPQKRGRRWFPWKRSPKLAAVAKLFQVSPIHGGPANVSI